MATKKATTKKKMETIEKVFDHRLKAKECAKELIAQGYTIQVSKEGNKHKVIGTRKAQEIKEEKPET